MLHIAFGADTNYIMQCGVAITSVCENNKDMDIYFHIMVLCEEEEVVKFAPLVTIIEKYGQKGELLPIGQKYFANLPEGEYISRATYLRLLLPKVLSTEIPQILYLDSDIVVLGSLKYFEEHPLDSVIACGATLDINGMSIKHHNRLGLSAPVTYFNAGILQMNLTYWRDNKIASQAIEGIAGHSDWWFMDQDAINVVLEGKISRIPYRYNLQTSHYLYPPTQQELDKCYHQELYDAMETPIIIHYASYRKPWQKGCPKHEFWLKYKKMTQWASCPMMKSKPNDDTTQEWIRKANSKSARAVNTYAPCFFKFIYYFSKVLPK